MFNQYLLSERMNEWARSRTNLAICLDSFSQHRRMNGKEKHNCLDELLITIYQFPLIIFYFNGYNFSSIIYTIFISNCSRIFTLYFCYFLIVLLKLTFKYSKQKYFKSLCDSFLSVTLPGVNLCPSCYLFFFLSVTWFNGFWNFMFHSEREFLFLSFSGFYCCVLDDGFFQIFLNLIRLIFWHGI